MQIFVKNLPLNTQENDVQDLFEEYGEVSSVNFIFDEETGQFKGFGFVEMPNDGSAQAAIDALNGFDWHGKAIVVKRAEESGANTQRTPRSGGGGYRRND